MRFLLRPFRTSAVLQFAVSGLVATVIIGVIAVAASRHAGTSDAIRHAAETTRLAGEGIVQPNLTEAALAGDRRALDELDTLVRERVMRDEIIRVKIWRPDGTIVYSDRRGLIGQRFPLGDDKRALMREPNVEAALSDVSRRENRFESGEDELLEVYLPIRGPDGGPLLFEAYQRFSSVAASGERLWLSFAPALLGGLLLLQLVNLPLARSMANRLRRGQQEREALLHRALDASQGERRMIAADLHDGIVQDLVAVAYGLAAEAQRVNGGDGGRAARALHDGAAKTRDSVRALRTLLVDIYPPNLHQTGLESALADLAGTYTGRGLSTTVDIEPCATTSEANERLLFRCAQETLRNVVKHANAGNAAIRLRSEDDCIVMEVQDDGCGFDDVLQADGREQAHFGLRMMADLARDAGGTVRLRTGPGTGTAVQVVLPA